jgi:hypothetical protein
MTSQLRAVKRSVVVNGGLPSICRRISLVHVGEDGLGGACDARQLLIF